MFYSLTNQQIQKSRAVSFPETQFINFNSIIFDTSGDNFIVKGSIFCQDSLNGSKIFKNENAKKYMKLRIFDVRNENVKTSINSAKTIEALTDALNSGGSFYIDKAAGTSFLGSLTDINEHYIQNNNLYLNYNFEFVVPIKNINFYSLGMVFYFDANAYSEDNKISYKLINPEILFGFTKIDDFFKNGVNINPLNCQDKRIVKQFFSSNGSSRLYDDINLDFSTGKQIIKNNTSDKTTLKKINSKVNKKFFSDIFISKNYDQNLDYTSLLFNVDFIKLITENTKYKNIIIKTDTDTKNEILEQYKISNIRIVRREIKKFGDKYEPQKETLKNIISSGERQNDSSVSTIESDDGLLREISINTGLQLHDIRTFETVDKLSFKNFKGYYQYGVELNITDGFTQYLTNLIKQLQFDSQILKQYLSETDKIIKTKNSLRNINPHVLLQTNLIDGYYDPLTSRFTFKFISDVFQQKFISDVFQQTYNFAISTAVARVIKTLKIFSINKLPDDVLTNALFSILNPVYGNQQTISYFIKIHDKIINQLSNIIKDNYNNIINISYWFENEYANIIDKSSVGYHYFNNQKKNGFGSIDYEQLETRVQEQISIYTKNNKIDNQLLEATKHAFIAPTSIRLEDKFLDFSSLINGANAITDKQFIDLELELKRYKFLGNKNVNVTYTNAGASQDKIENVKNKSLLEKYNTKITNISRIPDQPFKLSDDLTQINVNPLALYLGLTRKINEQYFNEPSLNENKNPDSRFGFLIKRNVLIPYHVATLITNNSRLFDKFTINDLKNLFYLSRFNFLFNTINYVEVLRYNNKMNNYFWTPLTSNLINKKIQNVPYLCRMKLYQNSNFFVSDNEQISLPIYNEYFLLSDDVEGSFIVRQPTDNLPRIPFITNQLAVPPPSTELAAKQDPNTSETLKAPIDPQFAQRTVDLLPFYINKYVEKYYNEAVLAKQLIASDKAAINEYVQNLIFLRNGNTNPRGTYEEINYESFRNQFNSFIAFLNSKNLTTDEDAESPFYYKWLGQIIAGYIILRQKTEPPPSISISPTSIDILNASSVTNFANVIVDASRPQIKLNLGFAVANKVLTRRQIIDYAFTVKSVELNKRSETEFINKYSYAVAPIVGEKVNYDLVDKFGLRDLYKKIDSPWSDFNGSSIGVGNTWVRRLMYDYCYNYAFPLLTALRALDELALYKFKDSFPYTYNRFEPVYGKLNYTNVNPANRYIGFNEKYIKDIINLIATSLVNFKNNSSGNVVSGGAGGLILGTTAGGIGGVAAAAANVASFALLGVAAPAAAVGSTVPIVGTVIGAAVGLAAGLIIGGVIAANQQKAADILNNASYLFPDTSSLTFEDLENFIFSFNGVQPIGAANGGFNRVENFISFQEYVQRAIIEEKRYLVFSVGNDGQGDL